MYVINVTNYDNMTDVYNNSLSIIKSCTINEKNIDRNRPTLLFTLTCGLSFICLMSLMVYTLIKPLINK